MNKKMYARIIMNPSGAGMRGAVLSLGILSSSPLYAGLHTVDVSGSTLRINNQPFKVIGLRCSNALVSELSKDLLIDNLPVFRDYGINTVSVFMMGSRFGDVKGYMPDSSLNPVYSDRMAEIIEAADSHGMIVLVGCLYWGTSEAKADLQSWDQDYANAAVANTVSWLKNAGYRNVIMDPDNEGMANAKKGWSISQMISAGKAVDSGLVIGYNDTAPPPANADILLHFSPRDKVRPYVESEGSADGSGPENYWGPFSRESGYGNYIRIGRYTEDMKKYHFSKTDALISSEAGYMLASTWLQCGPNEGIGGPFMTAGGSASNDSNWNEEPVKGILPDAGVKWWLDYIKIHYGSWTPPGDE